MTKRQMIIYPLVLLATIAVLGIIWKWNDWRAAADAGSGYAARITCSCRYIEGRSAKSCAGDIAGDAGMVTISEDADQKSITGSVPLMARRTARFKAGYGCLMEPQ
ncbi:MAG: hypothetical protein ABI395_02070 [Sphingobium sp.]